MTTDKPPKGSTTTVAAMRFRAHGRVDMWMEDDVLHYEATGPFNEEVFDLLAIAQLAFLKTLTLNGPWASICTLRHSAMSTPGGIQRYTEIMQSPKPPSFVPVATAFVVGPEIEGGKLMVPHFEKVYTLIDRPFRIFESMAQAQQWVQAMIRASRPCGSLPPEGAQPCLGRPGAAA